MRAGAILAAVAACGRVGFDRQSDGASIDLPAGFVTMFDATTSSSGDGTTGLAWNHVVQSGPAVVLVFVATRDGNNMAPPTVTSVQIGTGSATRIASLCPSCGPPSGINNLELWFAPAVLAGTTPVVVNLTGTASGATGIATSYIGPSVIDLPSTSTGTTPNPTLTWTPSPGANWAIAGAMDQGGFAMSLLPSTGQVLRTETVCDTSQFAAQTVADQVALAGGPITFIWTYASGSGVGCPLSPASHTWIVIGASFK
jgi:hypothetical protein